MLHGADGNGGGHGEAPEMEKERSRNGNRYRFRARQIGLNNVAQPHSTSRSHTGEQKGKGDMYVCRLRLHVCDIVHWWLQEP